MVRGLTSNRAIRYSRIRFPPAYSLACLGGLEILVTLSSLGAPDGQVALGSLFIY